MGSKLKVIIISALVGAIAGAGVMLTYEHIRKPSKKELIKDFYRVETAVHVSPHGLRKKMSKGKIHDYTLVDLRSAKEYEKEHIVTAINIPAYSDPDTSAYGDTERIIREFKKIPQDKDIIVYCYSAPCMTGRKIGKFLAENGIYVRHLGIGWNEWRYYWKLWNHDMEKSSDVDDYVVGGKKAGKPKNVEISVVCSEGHFTC